MNNSTSMITLTSLCEATWTSDDASDKCMLCGTLFGYLQNRRHHCRLSGLLVCSSCLGPKETKHLYTVGSSKVVESYVPPLSSLRMLHHPNSSATREMVASWMPTTLCTLSHMDPHAPRIAEPCGVILAKERSAWNFATCMIEVLPMLSKHRQRHILLHSCMEYHSHPESSTGFSLLGQWTHQLSCFQFYLDDISRFIQYPFARKLMTTIYNLWVDYFRNQKKGELVFSVQHAHTLIMFLLNLGVSNKIKMRSHQIQDLLNHNMGNALHLLLGCQLFHYSDATSRQLINLCWHQLHAQNSSIAPFIHHRLCCEAMCTAVQNVDKEHSNGRFRPFFRFLQTVYPNDRSRQAVICALLYNSLFCQRRFAQGCAHELHVDLNELEQFHTKCFHQLWNMVHKKPFAHIAAEDDPLRQYDHRLIVVRQLANKKNEPIFHLDQVVQFGNLVFFPIHQVYHAYAIQHITMMYFAVQSDRAILMNLEKDKQFCSRMRMIFYDTPELCVERGTLAYMKADILKYGTLHKIDSSISPKWKVSSLSLVLMYYMLLLDKYMPTEQTNDLPLVNARDYQAWDHDNKVVIMPYTLAACQAIKTYMCREPLTDALLEEVQQVCSTLHTNFMLELWIALLPFAKQSGKEGETRLRSYFQKLHEIETQDTFRSTFLSLLKQ